MTSKRIYLSINQKAKEEIKTKGSTKLPYLRMALPPEQEGGDWVDIGAAWMTDSKKGFNVKLNEGFSIEYKETPEQRLKREQDELEAEGRAKMAEEDAKKNQIDYPSEEINPEDIPF